ncbi:hypothetical protein [Rhizobium sp.]
MDAFGIAEPGLPRLRKERWLASSLLQKAIRRGDLDWGRAAARAIIEVEPHRLWRRLATIAAEDIGLADLTLVGDAVAAYRSYPQMDAEASWAIADQLVRRLVASPKDRSVDDLWSTAYYGRHLDYERRRYATLPMDQVVEVAVHDANVDFSAVATQYALGTTRPGIVNFGVRKGAPTCFFDKLLDSGYFVTVVEMGRDGWQATKSELFGLLPIMSRFWHGDDLDLETDEWLPTGFYDGVPSCAVDFFTRPGRSALARFLRQPSETTRWITEHIPPARHVEFLGSLLFRTDGGLCKDRLMWSLGGHYREQTDRYTHICVEDAEEAMKLFRSDFPAFDEERCRG